MVMAARMKPALGFGVVLREYRIMAGLTRLELAERSGLSVRAVSDMERGRTHPYTRSVGLLADALGLDDPAAERLLALRRRAGAGRSADSPGRFICGLAEAVQITVKSGACAIRWTRRRCAHWARRRPSSIQYECRP
jgi:transcriptional regulator with XRE-family HTH domain